VTEDTTQPLGKHGATLFGITGSASLAEESSDAGRLPVADPGHLPSSRGGVGGQPSSRKKRRKLKKAGAKA
jgi:hypothetical protein